MFIGHYAASFAVKRYAPVVPLWLLFLAVQFVDVLWAMFVVSGIEKARLIPGFMAASPLDLYYMPYTHSLVAFVLWSALAYAAVRFFRPQWGTVAATGVALAVFSHFPADAIVHRPDLPIYDDTWKAGLGLWRSAWGTYVVEAGLVVGTLVLFLSSSADVRWRWWLVAAVLLVANTINIYGPPPANLTFMCIETEVIYCALAALALWAGRSTKPAAAL
jgi:hypothetical protein